MFVYFTLLMIALSLTACAPRETGPPLATETQGMRLLRGVLAAWPAGTPDAKLIETLRANPAVQLPLDQFRRAFPNPVDAQLAWLAWWSSRYQDADLPPNSAEAASVVPLLLPFAEPSKIRMKMLQQVSRLFEYDPPLHQPAVDALAVLGTFDPHLLDTLFYEGTDLPGIQPWTCEQALARLLLAKRDPGIASLPMGLRLAVAPLTDQQVKAQEAIWIKRTLEQLRLELTTAEADYAPESRIIGQPLSSAGRQSILLLMDAMPADDPARLHPAMQTTLTLTLQGVITDWEQQPPTDIVATAVVAMLDAHYRLCDPAVASDLNAAIVSIRDFSGRTAITEPQSDN